MDWGDAATWVTGGITAMAVGFAALQLKEAQRQRDRVRQIDIDGVAVIWQAREVPKHPDDEGRSTAPWTITVHNPGDLPIRDVSIAMSFACDIQRVHYNRDADKPSRTLELDTPAVEGRGMRSWQRTIRVQHKDRHLLRKAQATVTFLDVRGEAHENRWGWGTEGPRPLDSRGPR